MRSASAERLAMLLVGLLVLWLILVITSVVMASQANPEGDGFVRGMNRIGVFVGWQIAAFVVAVVCFATVRSNPKHLSRKLQKLGLIPLYVHLFIVLIVISAVMYALISG